MRYLFRITQDFLMSLESVTGWSYKEINVIVWYFVIPATWAILLDRIFGKHFFKLGFGVIALGVLCSVNFESFSGWLFDRSADFLNGFNVIGSNYTNSSVIICLFVPLAIYAILIWLAFFRRSNKKKDTASSDSP